jgi:hypothetical protein
LTLGIQYFDFKFIFIFGEVKWILRLRTGVCVPVLLLTETATIQGKRTEKEIDFARNWTRYRDQFGAYSALIKEMTSEDKRAYKRQLRSDRL